MYLVKNHRWLIAVLVVFVGLGLLWKFLPSAWATSSDSVRKWAWSGQIDLSPKNYGQLYGLGWLSTNCLNDFDFDGIPDSQCANSQYGLNINIDGTNKKTPISAFDGSGDYLQGCAWSDIFGWTCFSQQSKGVTICPTNDPTYGSICNTLNSNGVQIKKIAGTEVYYLKSSVNESTASDIDGVVNNAPDARAAVLNLSQSGQENRSFVGFPFDPTSIVTPGGDVTGCFGCWSGQVGYTNSCKGCYLVNDGFSDSTLAPNPNILCTNCTQCQTTQYGGSCTSTANRCHANSCTCYKKAGVVVDYYPSCSNTGQYCSVDGNCTGGKCDFTKSTAELCGWGYNAYEANPGGTQSGFGWIAFNPVVYGAATPYTQAQRGSVYSENNILSYLAPPQGQSNAAYLIDAKGEITRWISSSTPELVRPFLANAPSFLGIDAGSGRATSTLGVIDFKGIKTVVQGIYNKFGAVINGIGADPITDDMTLPLNDSVALAHVAANQVARLDSNLVFPSGSNAISGAGIIYIEGNLSIEANSSYSNAAVSRLKHIPSIVWIVEGDVTISPTVTDVAGTFIVLGNGTSCPGITDPLNPPASNGCGRFTTGNDRTSPKQLRVYGNVIAHQLNLQRSYDAKDTKGRNQPAEIFIADGRLQSNPPAGLVDLSKSLPRFSFGF